MANKFDLVIKNGNVVMEDRCVKANIYIKDGKIAGITNQEIDADAIETIDAQNKFIMPGGIDCHSHIWEPTAYEYREDFYSGTCSSASGGITTILEMPLSVPPVTNKESFDNRVKYAEKSIVDYALWGAFIEDTLGNVAELDEAGCIAYKGFLSKASPEYPAADDYVLLKGMEEVNEVGSVVGVHAENNIIIDRFEEKFKQEKCFSGKYHEMSRPEISEIESIQKAILFAKHTGCRLHICHLSTVKAIDIINNAKKDGVKVTVETCPHYLTLTVDDLEAKGGFAKCNPPLRSKENMEQLWKLVEDGQIDCIGTDHTPYTDEDRACHGTDIWSMPPGIGASDLFMPIMIDEGYNKRGMDIWQISNLTSTNSAKIFGIYPQKGVIQIGSDADLVIVDADVEWTYRGEKSFSKSKCVNGPFQDRKIGCSVKRTILRGKTIYLNGEITAKEKGKLLKPNKPNKNRRVTK